MQVEPSKYNVFIDNYKDGINQFLNNVSVSFFSRIKFDKDEIIKITDDDFVRGKLEQIDAIKNDSNDDNFNKLKITGKILQDIAPALLFNENISIKRSGANIINSFFDLAKETEDEELLKTAVAISDSAKKEASI